MFISFLTTQKQLKIIFLICKNNFSSSGPFHPVTYAGIWLEMGPLPCIKMALDEKFYKTGGSYADFLI